MKIYSIYGGYYNTNTQPVFKAVSVPTQKQVNELRVFSHHIYEYEKGLRSLILTTEKLSNIDIIESKLKKRNIDYLIQKISDRNINVFFGRPEAVNVIRSFNQPKLNKYTPEQDFILGTLLGYDKLQQCERYLKFLNKK
ncbi:DUF2023 family protein [bacterium]|nr:DUF2023 family protein [bacterium]